jgi:hypothetical protein
LAFFATKLADNVFINIEAEAAGGLAKSRGEGGKDDSITPENAFINICKTMGLVSAAMAARVGPVLKQTNTKLDLQFGIKTDPAGNVMVPAQSVNGQFMCTLKLG